MPAVRSRVTHTGINNPPDDGTIGLPRKIHVFESRLHGEGNHGEPVQQLVLLSTVHPHSE